MTRKHDEVDHNVFDFSNAAVDDHGLDDGVDADGCIDSAHSAVDPESDADSYFSDYDIEHELDGITKDNDDVDEDNSDGLGCKLLQYYWYYCIVIFFTVSSMVSNENKAR